MQEDVAGLKAAGLKAAGLDQTYATCAECGTVFVRRAARTVYAGLNDGAASEYVELCPDCEKLDRQGEQAVVTGPEP